MVPKYSHKWAKMAERGQKQALLGGLIRSSKCVIIIS